MQHALHNDGGHQALVLQHRVLGLLCRDLRMRITWPMAEAATRSVAMSASIACTTDNCCLSASSRDGAVAVLTG